MKELVDCINCYNFAKIAKRTFTCGIDGTKMRKTGMENIDCSFFYSPADVLIGIDTGFIRMEWMKNSI